MAKQILTIFWHRRDLRIDDNAALYRALSKHSNVLPIFIFDKDILDLLKDKDDRRVEFIHHYITKLNAAYTKAGGALQVFYGKPLEVFKQLTETYTVAAVYTNRDYEPYAAQRDAEIDAFLSTHNSSFTTYKDQVIFEKGEILKDDGKPYTVYTPYSKRWRAKLNDFYLKPYPVEKYLRNLFKPEKPFVIPSLESMGFLPRHSERSRTIGGDVERSETEGVLAGKDDIIKHYHDTRNLPAVEGTSRLSVHLRFGTVSIRKLVAYAMKTNDTWLSELIWREFFMAILAHFPNVVGHAFKPQYDNIIWSNNEAHFEAWCNGQTGYPIVDAGMRELNETGFMHNRVRMIVASFLTKHLLIDWRWGEAYFARKLLDFELSANNGNWQWAAGCGCDAAPYFRVFSPALQTEKFDPKHVYIKRWVPEYQELTYPRPIVDHTWARNRALAAYKLAVS